MATSTQAIIWLLGSERTHSGAFLDPASCGFVIANLQWIGRPSSSSWRKGMTKLLKLQREREIERLKWKREREREIDIDRYIKYIIHNMRRLGTPACWFICIYIIYQTPLPPWGLSELMAIRGWPFGSGSQRPLVWHTYLISLCLPHKTILIHQGFTWYPGSNWTCAYA